mgnify:CR=1 FL=1
MLMSRAYLEGNDIFQEQAASRHGVLIDPRVSGLESTDEILGAMSRVGLSWAPTHRPSILSSRYY